MGKHAFLLPLLAVPLGLLARGAARLEEALFDGLAEGAAARIAEAGEALDRIHDGDLRACAAWCAAGVAFLGLVVLVGVLR